MIQRIVPHVSIQIQIVYVLDGVSLQERTCFGHP